MKDKEAKPLVRYAPVVLLLAAVGAVFLVSGLACDGKSGNPEEEAGTSGVLNLVNRCSEPLYVTLNSGSFFRVNGVDQCQGGQTCSIAAGRYAIDNGSSGMDFHVGQAPDNATKAEVTYVGQQFVFDISVITDKSQCPDSCGDPSCCVRAFNEPVKMNATNCACKNCSVQDGVNCASAYQYPHDDGKQVTCENPSPQELDIEFCPTSACSSGGPPTCTGTQATLCSDCTGDKIYCCPQESWGFNHECLCAVGSTWCAQMPDAGSGCGSDPNNYCTLP